MDGSKMHPRQFGNFRRVEDLSGKCPDVRPEDHTEDILRRMMIDAVNICICSTLNQYSRDCVVCGIENRRALLSGMVLQTRQHGVHGMWKLLC
ncbi:mucin-5B-like [Coturnix japonica]|uniref:mucin-5B-like n=1 Tax=Coturnix japonica TaxID=93934 RepID=UPI0007778AC2|nr:mucin-5B-like [Coturnix japonica]